MWKTTLITNQPLRDTIPLNFIQDWNISFQENDFEHVICKVLAILCWASLYVNSLWRSDTIWWQKSGSTLAQVRACCLTAPSHYLKQCWVIISEVQWHSYQGNFTRDASTINHLNPFENYISKISFIFPRGQWVNPFWSSNTIWLCSLGSILDLVMTFCLMAPRHYMIQCWFIINITRNISQCISSNKVFGNNIFRMPVTFPVAPFTLTWFDFNTSMDNQLCP